MKRTPEDERLVAAFLAHPEVKGQPGTKVGALVEGVHQTDVSRWRNGKWSWLSEEKRVALERFLNSHQQNGPRLHVDEPQPTVKDRVHEERSPYSTEAEDEDLRRIGAIQDPLLRIAERESLAATIRAQFLRHMGRAAEVESAKAFDRSKVPPVIGSPEAWLAAYRAAMEAWRSLEEQAGTSERPRTDRDPPDEPPPPDEPK